MVGFAVQDVQYKHFVCDIIAAKSARKMCSAEFKAQSQSHLAQH